MSSSFLALVGVCLTLGALLCIFLLAACTQEPSTETTHATPRVIVVVATPLTTQVTLTRTPSATPIVTVTPLPSATPFITPPAESDSAEIPILMYHNLKVLDASADDTLRTWTVNPEDFVAQLDYIKARGFHTVTLPQLVNFFKGGAPLPTHPIVLTFDDAWSEHYTLAFPELQKRGMVGVFFVPTSYAQVGGKLLNWAQVVQMDRGGMDIESHTINHLDLTKINRDDVRHQLVDAKKILEQKLGHPLIGLSYPYGAFNPQVVTATENAGYKAAVILCCGSKQRGDMMLELPRIRVAYEDTLQDLMKRLP
jgi:peptidoglycan/xylan/chitin deacetylase (PgdA/CDA1 family)